MSQSETQTTLTGDAIDRPECDRCENDATRELTLRKMSQDTLLLCDNCKFPSYKGPGGIIAEKRVSIKQ